MKNGIELSDQRNVFGVRLPSESDPNLFKRWIALVNELEYKLVFFEAIYLH